MTFEEIREKLKENAEEDFAAFSSKIVRTAYPMIGVRTPTIRKLARAADENYLAKTPKFYEEVLVAGFALGRLKPTADELFAALPRYLDTVDNWAAIDSPLSGMKAFKKDREKCFEKLGRYVFDGREYYARFGCVALLGNYMDEEHIDETLRLYSEIESGRYYVDMAVAWGLSVAAVKFFDRVYAQLKSGVYGKFVTEKAIRKCCESFRIPQENKSILKEILR